MIELYDAMSAFGVPAKLIRLVRITMTNVTCQVRVDGKLTEPFAATKGLRQGDGLPCLLFNLALERAIRDSRVETTGETIFQKSTQILAYDYDIDIVGLRLSFVAKVYQGIEQAAESLRLHINEAKTKLMVTSAALPINNPNLRRRDVQIAESTFEVKPLGQRSATTIAWKQSCAQGCWLPTGHSTV